MKKYFQITFFLSAFFLLVFIKNNIHFEDDEENKVVGPITTPSPIPSDQTGTIITPTPSKAAATGKYKDGKYDGSVEDAFYGPMQVQVTIQNGRIVDIIELQYPNDNRTSKSINEQALVFLKSEAIQAQSAQINIITGASDSSPAFSRSLESALKKAQ